MAEPTRDNYKTELDGLKAPLGIILFLIRKNNLDIYDIPIARITKEYLEYLDLMEQYNIELAGEFFVMASTLMRIKVQMLLRKHEDEEDPREDLVQSLIEYQKMVEAARTLKHLEEDRLHIFTRAVAPQDREHEPEVELELNLYQLMKAFREIAANFDAPPVREIELESFSIEEKIEAILDAIEKEKQVSFYDLFKDSVSRLELIVTLIALLELMKLSKVQARQEGDFGSIWLYRPETFDGGDVEEQRRPEAAGESSRMGASSESSPDPASLSPADATPEEHPEEEAPPDDTPPGEKPAQS